MPFLNFTNRISFENCIQCKCQVRSRPHSFPFLYCEPLLWSYNYSCINQWNDLISISQYLKETKGNEQNIMNNEFNSVLKYFTPQYWYYLRLDCCPTKWKPYACICTCKVTWPHKRFWRLWRYSYDQQELQTVNSLLMDCHFLRRLNARNTWDIDGGMYEPNITTNAKTSFFRTWWIDENTTLFGRIITIGFPSK